MTKKRIGSFLLCLAMLVSALPQATPAARAAAPTVTVAPTLAYASDPDAFIEEVTLSQSGAWNLTIGAKATGSGNAYAIIMSYADFQKSYAGDSQIGNISASNFDKLPGATATAYYRTQMSTASPGAVTLLNANLKSGTNAPFTVGETSKTYHAHYALVIFDGGTTVENLSDYTIGDFYVDSQGKLQTESYMLRYIKNSGSVGTTVGVNSMPAYQIEGWGTSAQVAATATASNPTRLGYTFVGWDANKDVMSTTPNDAAKQSPTVAFPRDAASPTLPWSTVEAKNGSGTHDRTKDLIYDLYAIWKPVMVGVEAVSKTEGAADATAEQTTKAKVGVAFEWQYNATGSHSATNPRVYGGNTTKTVSAQYSVNGGAFQDGLPAGMGLATTKQDAVMTYKTLDVKPSGETGKAAFCVTGRPTEYYSTEQPITIRLTVTDASNKTFVTQELHLSEIEKGSQSVTPDEDVSTGLETDVTELAAPPAEGGGEATEPAAEDTPDAPTKDGQILGFYSLGQTIPEEQGGHPNADGSGSLRQYYLNVTDPGMWNEALIYEYKPDTAEDTPDNWREVPLPKELYDHLVDGSTLARTDVETAMQKNAAVKIHSTLARGADGKVALASETPAPVEETPWAGWTDEYGSIEWDGNGCPVVHGLTEGAKYNVRFKANGDYDSSAPVTLTITKGGGGSSGGGSTEADVSKIRTVTFYDWDGTTKLGVVAVGVEEDPADGVMKGKLSKAAYKEFVEPLLNPDAMTIGDDTYEITPNADNEGYLFNPDRMTKPLLTDKGGYTFCGWTYMTEDEYGHYPSIDEAQAAVIDWNEEAITVNTDVMACYGGNSLCGDENSSSERRYTLEYSWIKRSGEMYEVEITAKRLFATSAGKFAARAKQPVIRVEYTPKESESSFAVGVELERKDVSSALVFFPSAMERAVITCSDMSGANGNVFSAVSFSRTVDLFAEDHNSRQNYIKFGTVELLNEEARKTESSSANYIPGFNVNSYFTQDLGISAAGTAQQKSKKILDAWRAANQWIPESGIDFNGNLEKENMVRLTYEQVQAVLDGRNNVYLKNVSFVDVDARAEYIQGHFLWERVAIDSSSVPTETDVASYNIYWSRNGLTKRALLNNVSINDGVVSIDDPIQKQYYDRYFIVCAVNSAGVELPASAVIPISEIAED